MIVYRCEQISRYSKIFTILPPTAHNLCTYHYYHSRNKPLNIIRPDNLSMLLTTAHIHPGGRYLVVDDYAGILTAGIAERMGGDGELVAMHEHHDPSIEVKGMMNLTAKECKTVRYFPWIKLKDKIGKDSSAFSSLNVCGDLLIIFKTQVVV